MQESKEDEYQAGAARAIDERLEKLRGLSYRDAAALPEASGEDAEIGDVRCAITTFKLVGPFQMPDAILVTVQVARRGLLGLASYHTERGLIFTPDGGVREATELELQNSGG